MDLSLLTAVHPPRSQHLAETARSVAETAALFAERGHRLEWVVVIDGPGEVPSLDEAVYLRVVRRPMNGGVSAARNTALSVACGTYVLPLDHDDLLRPNGTIELLKEALASASVWCAASPRLLNGSWTAHRVQQYAEYQVRSLEENWVSPFVFHPNVVMACRSAVLEVGGWPALTGNQDLGLVFALNRRHAGLALPYEVIGYRTWEEQTVSQDYYPILKAQDFGFLLAQINAERASCGLSPVNAPAPGNSHARPVR